MATINAAIHNNPVSTPGFVKGTPEWVQPIIQRAADKHGVPTMVLSSLLKQESGFNPNAVSPVGAQGIAQFMPATAKGMGVNPSDPESSIDGAATYIRHGLDRFGGKMDLALASYNAGGGAVQKYGGIPPYKETQNYVKNIMAMAGQQHETANQTTMDVLAEARKQQKSNLAMNTQSQGFSPTTGNPFNPAQSPKPQTQPAMMNQPQQQPQQMQAPRQTWSPDQTQMPQSPYPQPQISVPPPPPTQTAGAQGQNQITRGIA